MKIVTHSKFYCNYFLKRRNNFGVVANFSFLFCFKLETVFPVRELHVCLFLSRAWTYIRVSLETASF